MRSPKDMQIILIDITNACTEACSNCTRFCGNHKKPFFMSYETFCRALDSMQGFGGLTALIGGEPTLHPEFSRFARYLQTKFPKQARQKRLAYPQKNFIQELLRQEFESHVLKERDDGRKTFERQGVGIYSNMGASYLKHQELIQDTFQVQFLNDHKNPSFHQPGMLSRKDLGISDEEWIPMRDNCWLQNSWSATITPKGAFFCEVAAAFDMLFDGPGGWVIEPGWWRRTPADFGEQLQWCELCGFALSTFMRESSDEIDDVSPTLYKKLQEIGSPGLKRGRTHLVNIEHGQIANSSKANGKRFYATQKYVERYEDRFCAPESLLFSKSYEHFFTPDGDKFGIDFNRILAKANDWILFSADDNGKETVDKLLQCVLNPGTMHIGDGFVLFNKRALSLRKFGFDRLAHTKSLGDILAIWEATKVIKLADVDKVLDWQREFIQVGKRYAIWGMGFAGSFLADAVRTSGGNLVFATDRDVAKQGKDFYGAKSCTPSYLSEHGNEYDYLLIGHYSSFNEIKQDALLLGIPNDKIIMPYEV